MSGKLNNRQKKREQQNLTHNRKPGMGKYWKQLSNRRGRRRNNRVSTKMAEREG